MSLPKGIKSYKAAKKFLEGAKIIERYHSPTLTVTVYQVSDGRLYKESESHLEPPYNDYELSEFKK